MRCSIGIILKGAKMFLGLYYGETVNGSKEFFSRNRIVKDPDNPARKPWWRRWFGNRSERAAARFLRRLGYRILVRNYICPIGELDLVALDGSFVVFVEIRSTASNDLNRPAVSVDAIKQRRLTNLALHFLQKNRLLNYPVRFDVIALSWPAEKKNARMIHYPNAFEATGRFQMHQ
jgi:putative endonuclease